MVEVHCDHKKVIFSVYSNEQGDYLKIFERRNHDPRPTPSLIIDEANFGDLLDILDRYNTEYEQIAASKKTGSSKVIRTKSFTKGYRYYYVDVFEVRGGKHFRITMVVPNVSRRYVTFPFSFFPKCFKDLCSLLDDDNDDDSDDFDRNPGYIHAEKEKHAPGAAPSLQFKREDTIVRQAAIRKVRKKIQDELTMKPYNRSIKSFRNWRKNFWQQFRKCYRNNEKDFPLQNSKFTWKVYLLLETMPYLNNNRVTKHFGLAFQLVDTKCVNISFRIDLGEEDNDNRVSLLVKEYNSKKKNPLLIESCYLKEIEQTGNEILLAAHHQLKEMGSYNFLINNCQDFVKKLAKRLGIEGINTQVPDIMKKSIGKIMSVMLEKAAS